ncbi:hypothetical protein BRADI_3g27486v3, partial [Brachypodium distachyon]
AATPLLSPLVFFLPKPFSPGTTSSRPLLLTTSRACCGLAPGASPCSSAARLRPPPHWPLSPSALSLAELSLPELPLSRDPGPTRAPPALLVWLPRRRPGAASSRVRLAWPPARSALRFPADAASTSPAAPPSASPSAARPRLSLSRGLLASSARARPPPRAAQLPLPLPPPAPPLPRVPPALGFPHAVRLLAGRRCFCSTRACASPLASPPAAACCSPGLAKPNSAQAQASCCCLALPLLCCCCRRSACASPCRCPRPSRAPRRPTNPGVGAMNGYDHDK